MFRSASILILAAFGSCTPPDEPPAVETAGETTVATDTAPALKVQASELAQLDSLAKATLARLQNATVTKNLEYCGLILRADDGSFQVATADSGDSDGCMLHYGRDAHRVVANYHTHSAYDVAADSEVPSVLDLEGDMADGQVGYISTPGGRIWRTNVPYGVAIQICGLGCLYQDPNYEPGVFGPVKKRITIEALRIRQGGLGAQR